MTYHDITAAVYYWLSDVCAPWPVINFHQNAPQPNTANYVGFHVKLISGIAHDAIGNVRLSESAVERTIVGDRELTVHILAKGDDTTFNILCAVHDSLFTPSILDSIRANGLVFVDILMPITCVTEVEQTQFVERHVMDVKFRLAKQYKEACSYIEHVNANMKVMNPLNTAVIDKQLTI